MATDHIELNVVRIPIVGRASARVSLGVEIYNNYDVALAILAHENSVSPLITKSSGDGGIIVTDGENEIFFELTAPEKALLSTNRLFVLRVDLIDEETDVVFTKVFYCYAVQNYFSESFPMSALLSTRFLNTLALAGEAGGTGFLDGVATTTQTVPCQVQFTPPNSPPEQWVLEASTTATEAGVYRRPLDYSSSNQKVWRKVS